MDATQTGRADPPRKTLSELDAERDNLRECFPGWHIWYVPRTEAGGRQTITWCARPHPLLNCGSPDELVASMRAADQARAAGSDPG